MFQEFIRHGTRVDALRDEVVELVTQHAHDLRGKGIVENLDGCGSFVAVSGRHGAFFDVLAGARAQCLDVGEKGFSWHGA